MSMTETPRDEAISRRIAAEVRAEMARQGASQTVIAAQLGWQQARLARRLSTAEYATPFSAAELVMVAETLRVPVAQFLPEPAPAGGGPRG